MTVMETLRRDPRVKEVWSEKATDDGYWVGLKKGFADMAFDPHTPFHTIHEWTWEKIRSRMRDVKPCNCSECREQP